MNAFLEHHQDNIKFSYRFFDRLIQRVLSLLKEIRRDLLRAVSSFSGFQFSSAMEAPRFRNVRSNDERACAVAR